MGFFFKDTFHPFFHLEAFAGRSMDVLLGVLDSLEVPGRSNYLVRDYERFWMFPPCRKQKDPWITWLDVN